MINIFILIAGCSNLILAILVFAKNRNSQNNISFSILSFILALWAFAFIPYNFPFVFDSVVWIKVIYFLVIWMVGAIYYFSYAFPDNQRPPGLGLIIYVLLNIPVAVLLIFTNYFVVDVLHTIDGPETKLGFVYPFISAVWAVYAFMSFFQMVRKYRRSVGRFKLQLRYMLIGLGLFSFGAIILDGLFPIVFHTSAYFSLSAALPFFFIALTGYSIIKHRLMDLRLALQELIVFVLVTLVVSSIFLSSALVYWRLTDTQIKTGVIGIIIIISTVATLIFERVYRYAKFFAGRYLFQSIYDYQETLKSLSTSLSTYLQIDKLVDIIIDTLIRTMKLHRVAVLVRDFSNDHYKIQKTVGFNEENGISMVRDNFLTLYLEQNPKIIVLEEIGKLIEDSQNLTEKERLKQLYDHMEHIEAALIIPIVNSGRMISLIVLGHKISGDSYTVQDIDLLITVASQASIALENSRLYREVSDLNQDLHIKVNEATTQLQAKNVDLEKANENLKSLDKMKDQLIAVASHELRTPASNVQNYLWMVLTRPKPTTVLDPEDKESLQKSLTGIRNLIKLIADILDVSKIEGGKMEVKLQAVGYEEVVRSAVDELMPRAQKKGLSLNYIPAPNSLSKAMADPTKLKEVLTNLITNAIKYTEHGGIIVSTVQKEDEVVFSVKDTGRGIASENIPKLFQKFYREDNSLSASNPETGGTGLGLYITKSIIELMHGKIRVESILNQGSIFYFSLPTVNAAAITASPSRKVHKGVFTAGSSGKKKILLIEDEYEMRTFYSELLSGKYEVDTAIDGIDGIAKLRLKTYDLVLLDIMMPKLNGVGFLEEQQKDPALAKIPVILLTNFNEEETLKRCFELGAKSMIIKSDVLPDQIISVIEKEF